MLARPLIAVLDANVLFPFTLRDTLLRVAGVGFYQPRWTSQILNEMERNLVGKKIVSREQSARLRATMERAFPDAMVVDYHELTASMRNDAKDRHVAAAAVKAGAKVITTSNIRDFHDLPEEIEAQLPDDFLCGRFAHDPRAFVDTLREQASDLRHPSWSFEQLVARLAKMVPKLATLVRSYGR